MSRSRCLKWWVVKNIIAGIKHRNSMYMTQNSINISQNSMTFVSSTYDASNVFPRIAGSAMYQDTQLRSCWGAEITRDHWSQQRSILFQSHALPYTPIPLLTHPHTLLPTSSITPSTPPHHSCISIYTLTSTSPYSKHVYAFILIKHSNSRRAFFNVNN